MPAPKIDPDTQSGVSAALHKAFNGVADADAEGVHVGAMWADAEFAALLAQLNNPPPQYQGNPNDRH